jgi:hypothetical protein
MLLFSPFLFISSVTFAPPKVQKQSAIYHISVQPYAFSTGNESVVLLSTPFFFVNSTVSHFRSISTHRTGLP